MLQKLSAPAKVPLSSLLGIFLRLHFQGVASTRVISCLSYGTRKQILQAGGLRATTDHVPFQRSNSKLWCYMHHLSACLLHSFLPPPDKRPVHLRRVT